MAITRETDFVFDATRNADGLNRGAIRLLADDLNFGVGVQTFTTEGASLLTWTPGNVGAATNVLNYNGRGWAIHLSKFSVSGGTVRMPAQDILIRINITSTASSVLTLAVGQYTPTVSLWELGAASGQQRIAFTTGAQTATRGLGAPGFVVVTLSVPEWEFTTDSTLSTSRSGATSRRRSPPSAPVRRRTPSRPTGRTSTSKPTVSSALGSGARPGRRYPLSLIHI